MAAPEVLKQLGRYDLTGVLGKGTMGIVYEGLDPRLNRKVAIKTILKGHLDDEAAAKDYSMRFIREAQSVARLNHANIVQVYDSGEQGDIAYIVMEFIKGKELKTFFDANERFELKESVRIMCELLDALELAHEAGIVHRDIKPANVMLDSKARVKLADFGVARITDDRSSAEKTQAGTIVGTPAYMSPEQITGGNIDRRSDIFSAGIILYQFLTGKKPFTGSSAWTIAKTIIQDHPPAPSSVNNTISPLFDAVVNKALAKTVEQRYQSAREFGAALKRAHEGKSGEDESEKTVVTSAIDLGSIAKPSAHIATASAEGTGRTSATSSNQEVELEFWRAIKDGNDPDDFELYVQQFPNGIYAALAKRKIAKLRGVAPEETGAKAQQASEQEKKEAEEAAKREEEAKRKLGEEKAKLEAQLAQKEAEYRKREAAQEARRLAEAKARPEADANREAEMAKREAEREAKRLAEAKARPEADARREAEAKARAAAEEKARLEAIEKARKEAQAEHGMSAAARPLGWLMRLLAIAAMLTALFFLLPLGVPYLENAETYALVRRLLAIDRQCTDFVRALVPFKVSGYDTARGIIVVLAFVVSRVFSRLRRHFAGAANVYAAAADAGAGAGAAGAAGAAGPVIAGGVKSRAALLEIMAETKKRLDTMRRDLAFLSIDVVGSTDMKIGEDKMKIELDFREYKKFVDAAIAANGALAAAWTPDGVMICFATPIAAVTAAQNVIVGLRRFNDKVKTIRGNFQVRCGVNAGSVFYDRSIPMEQMSDHVIDVAGHMQKYALPNTIALAKPVMTALGTKREGFDPAGREVDGFEVYQWGE